MHGKDESRTEVRSLHETILSPKQRHVWKMSPNRQNGAPPSRPSSHAGPTLSGNSVHPLYTRVSQTWHCSHSRPGFLVLGAVLDIVGCLAVSSASLVAQTVKNTPAMQETQEMQVLSLGQEDPPREGNGNPF